MIAVLDKMIKCWNLCSTTLDDCISLIFPPSSPSFLFHPPCVKPSCRLDNQFHQIPLLCSLSPPPLLTLSLSPCDSVTLSSTLAFVRSPARSLFPFSSSVKSDLRREQPRSKSLAREIAPVACLQYRRNSLRQSERVSREQAWLSQDATPARWHQRIPAVHQGEPGRGLRVAGETWACRCKSSPSRAFAYIAATS
eukprot:220764-Pleurochrysis_carterae.AAC.2